MPSEKNLLAMKKQRPYWGLWIILTFSLVFFTFISTFDTTSIYGWKMKNSGIYENLTYKPDNDIPAIKDSVNNSIIQKDGKAAEEKSVLDTIPQSILFIGDSMLEGLGPRMGAYAKKNGHQLRNVIWYSSTTETWGSCDTLKHFIRKFKPSYVIVCLGANELFVRNIKTKRTKYLRNILSQIGNIPYVWIGPPNWKEDTGINQMLQESLSDGSFFLSKNLKFDRSSDGAHPTRSSAAKWMDSVARWMINESVHPIKMDVPDEKSARAATVILQPKK